MASSLKPIMSVRPDDQFGHDLRSRHVVADHDGDAIVPNAVPLPPRKSDSMLPGALRFPLAILLTFGLNALFNTFTAPYTGRELASVKRALTSDWQIAAMMAWKATELSIAWYANYDYVDLAYITILSQLPHYFLLNTFYGINYLTALVPFAIEVSSQSIPFALLRGVNKGHHNAAVKTENQQVAQDYGVQWLSGLFGSALYALVVYGSFQTWLPVYIVTHFDGVRSMEKVHSTVLPMLFAIFAPLGYAATQFILVPAIGSSSNPGITDPKIHPERVPFNPETASFTDTILYNLGLSENGVTPRAGIIAKRTATLAAYTFINAFVRSYVTVEGTELLGALGWAAVWTSAAGITGLALAWVGDE